MDGGKHAGGQGAGVIHDILIQGIPLGQSLSEDHPEQFGFGSGKRKEPQHNHPEQNQVEYYSYKSKGIVYFKKTEQGISGRLSWIGSKLKLAQVFR